MILQLTLYLLLTSCLNSLRGEEEGVSLELTELLLKGELLLAVVGVLLPEPLGVEWDVYH